jgi:hypothetical protein
MSATLEPSGHGRAEVVRMRILPTWEADAGGTAGSPAVPNRMTILPTLEFDMANPADGISHVSLILSPPAGADMAVVTRDLAELAAAVEAYRAAGDKAALVEAWKRCLDDGFTVTAR